MDDTVSLTQDATVFFCAGAEVTSALVEVAEELLHPPCGCEANEQASWRRADEREGVRHTSRAEHRSARTQVVAPVTDFDDVLAGNPAIA